MYIKDSYLESKNIFQCVLCLYILPVVYFTISYCRGHTISWFPWKRDIFVGYSHGSQSVYTNNT